MIAHKVAEAIAFIVVYCAIAGVTTELVRRSVLRRQAARQAETDSDAALSVGLLVGLFWPGAVPLSLAIRGTGWLADRLFRVPKE
jgi:hypothetical protein